MATRAFVFICPSILREMSALPANLEATLEPLWRDLPLESAMPHLLPKRPHPVSGTAAFQQMLHEISHPGLLAGLWLFVDDLDASHRISQTQDDATGCFWHAIMHRREGDFSNSKYWFRRAELHPAMERVEGYDPYRFVDDVAAASGDPAHLVDLQRREWMALFTWCANEAS